MNDPEDTYWEVQCLGCEGLFAGKGEPTDEIECPICGHVMYRRERSGGNEG